MSIYEMPNLTSGIDDALVNTVAEVSVFAPMFLFFVFMVVLVGGATNQKRRTGSADMPMWTVLAALVTLMISLLMTVKRGLIQGEVLSIVVAITVFSGMWLFFDRNRNEV